MLLLACTVEGIEGEGSVAVDLTVGSDEPVDLLLVLEREEGMIPNPAVGRAGIPVGVGRLEPKAGDGASFGDFEGSGLGVVESFGLLVLLLR
jgi:hypothetical protein